MERRGVIPYLWRGLHIGEKKNQIYNNSYNFVTAIEFVWNKQDSFGNVLRAFFKRRGVDPNEKKHLRVIFVLTLLEMENYLFARTTSFSKSQKAALSLLFYRLETEIFQVCTPFMIILKNTLFVSRKQFI
jgi:hypothetical protein